MVSGKRRTGIVVAASIAFVAKLLIALNTYGTNDVYTYERFGVWAGYFGAELYRISPDLNHPPSMLHGLRFLIWVSGVTGMPFEFWLRLAGILADVGTLWLICRILGPRLAERSVYIAVLLIAIAPTEIMISGFHGNTDPVMIFFVLAAVWLAGYRGQAAAGGMVWGIAICIKITPIVLAPLLFLSLSGIRKRIALFSAAAAVVLIAWAPYLYREPRAVLGQVFGYKSSYGLWGISWLCRELANAWPASGWINSGFNRYGSSLVLAAIVAISVKMNLMPKKPSLYAQAGLAFLLFFSATSGFAVQYLAWLTPWVAELGALPVAWYVLTGSVFLLVVYNYWNLGMPWYLAIAYPWSSHQYFQLLCWVSVLILTYRGWRGVFGARKPGVESLKIGALYRFSPAIRYSAAGAAIGAFVVYPAVVHMRRDTFPVTPTYAGDDVLYERADEFHNLAAELAGHGRKAESDAVQSQSAGMVAVGQRISAELARAQQARSNTRTPEEFVDASLEDYNRGDFGQCVYDASESLKLRPGMPAAWNNIALCNGELGNWDAAVAGAIKALRIEPESEVVKQNLNWALSQRARAASSGK